MKTGAFLHLFAEMLIFKMVKYFHVGIQAGVCFCTIFWRPLFLDCLSSLVGAEHLRWKRFQHVRNRKLGLICPS